LTKEGKTATVQSRLAALPDPVLQAGASAGAAFCLECRAPRQLLGRAARFT